MKIFITGATGYLGYHLVNIAIARGHQILCLRRQTSKSLFEPNEEKNIQWVTKENGYEEVVLKFEPDVLIHAAWEGVRGEDRNNIEIQNNNVAMSRHIFGIYPYKQIISIGSQAEYGYYNDIISEDFPLNPTMEYAKAKVKCCNEMQLFCEKNHIEWQWIRIFTVFGEKQTGGLIKEAIDKCLSNVESFNTTKGEQKYSYLYVLDFANAICNMIGSKGKSGIYNLSQPYELKSNREILESIKRLTSSEIIFNFGAIPYPDRQVMLMDGCVDKFEKAFGKIPCTDFLIALKNTIDSFRN